MKKIFLTFVAIMATISSFAQQEVWWGYYQDDEDRTGLGINAVETYDQAIFIPGDFALAKGKKIKAVRFFLRSKTNLQDVKLWLNSTLPDKVEDAETFIALETDNLNGKDDKSQTKLGTLNEVVLPEAYTITDAGVYVGYSFTMKNKTGSTGQYPIVIGGTPVQNSLFLRTSKSVAEWNNFSGNYGNLAVQVLLEGEFTENALSPEDFGGHLVGLNEPFTVDLKMANLGIAGVNDFDYVATIDGVAGEEEHVTLDLTNNVLGSTVETVLPFDALTELGSKTITINITKVNGQPNQAEKTSAMGSVTVVEELFKRVVLVEEFTGESCPNCPRAANGLATVLHNAKYAGKIAAVCHHSGYGDDTYTTAADKAYTWFFNDRYTFAPAMMYDRWTGDNMNYSGDQPSPCYGVGGASDISENVDKRLKVDVPVKIDLEAAFNADKSEVNVKVAGKRMGEWATNPARINLVLTEDSIKTTRQSGASGTFWHMHVSRAVNSTWGDVISWSGDEYSYEYTFKVNSKWNPKQLKVVAYVHCYDSSNPNNCEVANAAIVTPEEANEPDAIETIGNAGVQETRDIFTLDGKRIAEPQKGLNLVRMANGKVVKVIVK